MEIAPVRSAATGRVAGAGPELSDALAAASSGGKRLRPRMVELAAECFGGADPAALTAVADAVEWLHTAFVVHDDVIDRDDVRRGDLSVPGRFAAAGRDVGADPDGARLYGVAGAVLTGDLALSAAFRSLAVAPVDPASARRLFDLVDEALAVSASGELADVRFSVSSTVPSLEEVLRMEEDKTAAYTFSLPMAAGALLAGADDAMIEEVWSIGLLLGLAFQLRDDLDGMFAIRRQVEDKETSDLREGKMTALMVHASTTASWPLVEPHLGDAHVSTAQLAQVRHVLEAAGSRTFVEELSDDLEARALAHAAERNLPPELVPEILGLCQRPHLQGTA